MDRNPDPAPPHNVISLGQLPSFFGKKMVSLLLCHMTSHGTVPRAWKDLRKSKEKGSKKATIRDIRTNVAG